MVVAKGEPLAMGIEKAAPLHIVAARSKITGVGSTVSGTALLNLWQLGTTAVFVTRTL
jgi:hypothetical protein